MNHQAARYQHQPLVFDAARAHADGTLLYRDDGTVLLTHPSLSESSGSQPISIGPERQYPLVFASMMDLSKALSQSSNSPIAEGDLSLRERFDREFEHYRRLVEKSMAEGQWEPDYGSYVYDRLDHALYLVLPEYWHRIALVTSAGALLQDVERCMTWAEVRRRLDNFVVGVIGASVGGNLVEGVVRELRPRRIKVADPDWVELNNLNRFERGNLFSLGRSRRARADMKNAFDMPRINKAEFVAYTQQLVDPYSEWFVYPEGLGQENLDEFLLGNGNDEPRLDFVVEEADDLPLKMLVRARCRQLKIPVLMLTDFGHAAIAHLQDFKRRSGLPLAYECSDEEASSLLDRGMTTGNRDDIFAFVEKFVGRDCLRGEFFDWVRGEGEQPTSSLPQSGSTAMLSGGIGGKWAALYALGHRLPERAIYDLCENTLRG